MSGGSRNSVGVEMDSLDKRTRFQVNRVDAQASQNGEETDNLCDDDEDARESNDEERVRLYSESYDTKYAKSFRHFTREALPRMDNYRNIMSIHAAYRPTLDELHDATLHGKPADMPTTTKEGGDEGTVKFGWVQGVLVRCLLNIWGVMLFLRLSWVVGQAGIGEAMIVILGATVVTTITSLSMSAISTNGVIKGGGTYYMISRSLGPEFGGSIGLIFSLANAVACAMYVVGFCESFNSLLGTFDVKIVDGDVSDIRIIGSITILVLTGIVCVGMEWEAKAQLGLLVILVVAILDFTLGTFIGPKNDEERAKGFLGYDNSLLNENFWPDYRPFENTDYNFFSVFSIFFPAATGILAGANISGDLEDPQHSIPKGTLLAILITTISYLVMALQCGWTVQRDASGDISELNGTISAFNCTFRDCKYGLHNTIRVMEIVSAFGPLIYAGCFAATLSSALASLVSAPKVFQALCKDRLYPYISWFGKGYGKNNEPVRGYILTFFIAIAFILIGNLNSIAPLISNFFLAAYALINFSTFHASLAKPVGWRPTFKFYNMWLSLAGALLCVAVMILISWWTAVITLAIVLSLYLIVAHRKPDVNWGSTTQAQTYKNALTSIIQLNNVEDHVKNYRPQIMVLSALPSNRPQLIDFAYLLTKNLSLLICGHVIKDTAPQRIKNILAYRSSMFLRAHKIKAFYAQVDELSFEAGAKALLQASGIGKLKPNILLMGYKSDWQTCKREELVMYFNVLHKAFDMHMAVSILRLKDGLDYSKYLSEEEEYTNGHIHPVGTATNFSARRHSQEFIPRNESFIQMSAASSASDLTAPSTPNLNKARNRVSESPNPEVQEADTTVIDVSTEKKNSKKEKAKRESRSDLFRGPGGAELPKEILNKLTQFQRKQKKGTIDVWWLYDDGGLTLLLPYIISTRSNWSSCKLRVFTLANKKDELEFEQRSMASLLAKFRIDYSDLTVIPDITKKPQEKTSSFFETLIKDMKITEEENPENSGFEEGAKFIGKTNLSYPKLCENPYKKYDGLLTITGQALKSDHAVRVTEAELLATKDKTNRHLRLRELLIENSMDSSLIVMTLPMPRKNVISAALYMAWLEVLTQDMPPFLLVRGNQTSVLTFYS